MSLIPFNRVSYSRLVVAGECLHRLLVLGDRCDQAFGGHTGQWVRLIVRMYRGSEIPDHIGLALDDIEQSALSMLNT